MVFCCRREPSPPPSPEPSPKQGHSVSLMNNNIFPGPPPSPDNRKMSHAEIAKLKGESVCALYPFVPTLPNELAFQRDDVLKVYADFDKPWQTAVNTRTGETGLIPHNYVTSDISIAGALSAWYPVNRIEAEKRLLLPGTATGTYLIRPSRGTLTIKSAITYPINLLLCLN